MIADDPRAAAGLEPAASLMSVRVKRRKAGLQPSGKRGDLTAESAPPLAAPAALPSAAVIVLPPPVIDRHAQQKTLPFAEVMLPELADEAPEAAPHPDIFAPEPPDLPTEAEPLDLLLWSASDAEPVAAAPEPEPAVPEAALPVPILPEAALPVPILAEAELPEPIVPEAIVPEAELTSAEPVIAAVKPDAELEPRAAAEPEVAEVERAAEIAPSPVAVEPEIVEAEIVEIEPRFARLEPRLVEVAMPEPEAEPEPPIPLVAEPSLAVTPPTPLEDVATPGDILDYWDSLRGGRDVPPLDELDRAHVATWPNTVLLAVDSQDLPRITRLGESDGAIEYTSNVIDWIMSRGRNSAKRGEPMEEERRFAGSEGSARYRLLLLPFSSYGLSCDHVLCHLSRAPEISAVASFKRWLAG